MGIPFIFFDKCVSKDVESTLATRMIGYYNRNSLYREMDFIKNKYKRSAVMVTYYILWSHCLVHHSGENVMIWEDSIVINTNLCREIFANTISGWANEVPPTYDLLLLGHFPQQFKTYYYDDGKYRIKNNVPVDGYKHFSDHLLQLKYSFPSGCIIYTPKGLRKLISHFEKNVITNQIYPVECFIANMMDELDTYCVNPSLVGQLLDSDSVVLK